MAKKLLLALFSFVLIFISSLPYSAPAQAEAPTCADVIVRSVEDSRGGGPKPAHEGDKEIYLEIDTGGAIQSSNEVSIYIKHDSDASWHALGSDGDYLEEIPLTPDKKIKIERISIDKTVGGKYTTSDIDPRNEKGTFKEGRYEFLVVPVNLSTPNENQSHCKASFNFASSPEGESGYCSISYLSDNDYTILDTKVGIKVNFADPNDTDDNPGDTEDTHHHRIKVMSRINPNDQDYTPTTTELKNGWVIPKQLDAATYVIEVREHARSNWGENEGRSCTTEWPFLIETEKNGGGYVCSDATLGCEYTGIIGNAPLAQPCDSKDFTTESGCLRVKTALGTVGTEASEFVRWLLGFILGISGGIVLIIIIITGYRLMTSQGDPEKVKNARDQLTAAVVGLLFIIFSLVILQLITADILQLPGFGQP